MHVMRIRGSDRVLHPYGEPAVLALNLGDVTPARVAILNRLLAPVDDGYSLRSYSPAEVARIVGVGERTLARYRAEHAATTSWRVIGGRVRYRAEDIETVWALARRGYRASA